MPALSHRLSKTLYACIVEYIESGEPVGSRTLARKHGLELSAASIRNLLADLEEAGYLHQPHTSSGRVPTDRAFRLFVDTLLQVRPLSVDEKHAITRRFDEVGTGEEMLTRSGKILSELTGTAAVVVQRQEARTLRQLRFIPTRPGELLAVLVMSDDTVENCFLRVDGPIGEPDLARVHELLHDVIEGRTLGEVRELCARRLDEQRLRLDEQRRLAFELGQRATHAATRSDLVLEGQALLLDRPEIADVDRVKELVRALGDRELLVRLLDETASAERASVLVGQELGELAGGALSVVTAPYKDGGRVAGAIGVLDIVRMDYSKILPVVSAAAEAMTAAIDRARSRHDPG